MTNTQKISQDLMNMYLGGAGVITQTPGQTYTNPRGHKGYDIGIKPTNITPSYSGRVTGVWQDPTGYGTRMSVYNPQTNKTDVLSHLSKVYLQAGQQFQPGVSVGMTGGVPGTYGAGRTTGAHIDVESYPGMVYANMLSKIAPVASGIANTASGFGSAVKQAVFGRPRMNVNQLLSTLRSINPRIKAV